MRNLIFKTAVATSFLVSASAAHAEIGGGPMPQTPSQQWVPPQCEYDPAPHYADRTLDGRLIHPPMTVPGPNGGLPIFVPGGEKPAPGIAPQWLDDPLRESDSAKTTSATRAATGWITQWLRTATG